MPQHVEPGSIFSSRYVIHDVIGEGGMATVYRALDQVEGKPVAVKVLRRELAQAVGAERFAREVDIASTLEHPNVVSLTDAGSSGEWLYCVMPLFEGETLRDRLEREGQLPIEDALTIAGAVAQGLDYAHARNIVHRDVKPENILLSDDTVGLADFGIARAVVQAEEDNKLTTTGIVIGTPTYMSPEQAAADKVDGRADIYALGCVLYEMLSGGEPFTAPTAQGLLARHVRDPVPDVRTVRPGAPDAVWFAIQKAMAKAPADRFKTAGAFMAATRTAPALRTRDWGKVVGTVVAIGAVAGATLVGVNIADGARNVPLVDSLVAVLPFSLQAPDSSDRWLANAIPASIGPLLEGTAGLTAVSERQTDEALRSLGKSWDDRLTATEAQDIARRVGAGSYLMGDVMSDGIQRRITAHLYDTRTGEERMNPVQVRLDTLEAVTAIDRIYGQILISLVDESNRAPDLLTRSQESLRSYVEGWRARKAGNHVEASRLFLEATRADSTFPLASLAFLESLMWVPDGSRYLEQRDSITPLALASRDQLSEPDRALLDAMVATYARFASDTAVSGQEALDRMYQATIEAGDRSSAWLLLGDLLLHDGSALGIEDNVQLAREAFDSALAKGDFTTEAEYHLNELRFLDGDTAFIRQYVREHPPTEDRVDPLWWGGIWILQDTAAIAQFDTRMAALPRGAYAPIMVWALRLGVGFSQADRAAELLAAAPTLSTTEAEEAMIDRTFYNINRGRPAAAARAWAEFFDEASGAETIFWLALGGMQDWIDLDSLRAVVEPSLGAIDGYDELFGTCAVGQWHARWGDSETARRMREALQLDFDYPHTRVRFISRSCDALIEAAQKQPIDSPAFRRADSLLAPGAIPGGVSWFYMSPALSLAELYEARGRPGRALPLTKRVRFLVSEDHFYTPALVMEGRLSLAVSDTARAIEAYGRAITLLSDPEPRVERIVQEMRETLAELLAR